METINTNILHDRVYALYRVSSLGQVEKDDIPMQKQYCREFAARQGWTIVREFSEKGVSGFKVSAKDRDAIQEIQRDAALGKFDILLVFMFDRLGRRDDETPFVVEWFARNGIEVWSAMEGQQRFDSHVDKLMNYIRYWQASGESLKTSIRTKTRLGQLTEEGHYTGGTVPFGYRAVDKGRVNKRNRTVLDLEIDEDEAEIVRLIFQKYVTEGYGALRISRYLHEQGIKHRDGRNFPNTSLFYARQMQPFMTPDTQPQKMKHFMVCCHDMQRLPTAMKMWHLSTIRLNCGRRTLVIRKGFCGCTIPVKRLIMTEMLFAAVGMSQLFGKWKRTIWEHGQWYKSGNIRKVGDEICLILYTR